MPKVVHMVGVLFSAAVLPTLAWHGLAFLHFAMERKGTDYEANVLIAQQARNAIITFGLSAPIYAADMLLACRSRRGWFPFTFAVVFPLLFDGVVSELPPFRPRGDYFGAIWLFGPQVAILGLGVVAVVRFLDRREADGLGAATIRRP